MKLSPTCTRRSLTGRTSTLLYNGRREALKGGGGERTAQKVHASHKRETKNATGTTITTRIQD